MDLTVREGEIFGFLGPNGAGKTTTLRMLATTIQPDGGEATIAGITRRDHRRPGVARIFVPGLLVLLAIFGGLCSADPCVTSSRCWSKPSASR